MEYAFQFGNLGLRWFSVFVTLGILAGGMVGRVEARRRGEPPGDAFNFLLIGVPVGLAGARLYHVADEWDTVFSRDPVRALFINEGGLGIYGAIAGGALAMVLYARWKGLRPAIWLDIAAPGMLLGQAIGRWGNFFNQELYGRPTDLPWAITIDRDKRLTGYQDFTTFHPLFFYEFLLDLLVFGALMYAGRRWAHRLRPGDVALMYGVAYGVIRMGLESLRVANWTVGPVPTATIISAALALGCGTALAYRHWWRPRAERRAAETRLAVRE